MQNNTKRRLCDLLQQSDKAVIPNQLPTRYRVVSNSQFAMNWCVFGLCYQNVITCEIELWKEFTTSAVSHVFGTHIADYHCKCYFYLCDKSTPIIIHFSYRIFILLRSVNSSFHKCIPSIKALLCTVIGLSLHIDNHPQSTSKANIHTLRNTNSRPWYPRTSE